MDHVDTYLMHHGVKGQQWGNKHGPPYPLDDNPSKQAYKKKKAQQASSDSRKEQKRIAKQERAEYKKKKLPRTSLGLALKNSTMSDAEFREASKKLKRDREVYDGIISDMYRLERAVNLPGMFLNDGVKAIKNIDYIYGLITGSSMTEARRMLARSNSISNRMVGKKNTRIAKNNTGLYYGVGSYLSGDSPRAGGSAAYKNFLDSRLSTKMGDAIPMNMISTSEYDRLMSQFKHSDLDDNYLCHYGVLGMKWGRRKARPDVNSERHEKLNKVKAKVGENLKPWKISGSYKQNTYNHNQSPYQETTKVTASGGININPLSAEKTNEYAQKIYELKQRIPRLYHSDLDGNYLCHYGVKGMKWGVRNDRDGKPRNLDPHQIRISKEAEKDAIEFARAKMFYGEGAGNRRKLIKNSVEAKKKKSEFYANEFNNYLQDQDMEVHTKKAVSERHRKDTAKTLKKGGKKAIRVANTIFRYI